MLASIDASCSPTDLSPSSLTASRPTPGVLPTTPREELGFASLSRPCHSRRPTRGTQRAHGGAHLRPRSLGDHSVLSRARAGAPDEPALERQGRLPGRTLGSEDLPIHTDSPGIDPGVRFSRTGLFRNTRFRIRLQAREALGRVATLCQTPALVLSRGLSVI